MSEMKVSVQFGAIQVRWTLRKREITAICKAAKIAPSDWGKKYHLEDCLNGVQRLTVHFPEVFHDLVIHGMIDQEMANIWLQFVQGVDFDDLDC